MRTATENAYDSILDTYTPLDIKDIVYLFIATVCYDLAQSHDLLHKTMQEVEDWQLSIDLEHRKNQLTVIDGGKS